MELAASWRKLHRVLRQLHVCPDVITCEGIATRKARWTTSHLANYIAFGILFFEGRMRGIKSGA